MVATTILIGVDAHGLDDHGTRGAGSLGSAATQGNMADHPLTGSWIVRANGSPTSEPPLLMTFGVGGTLLVSESSGNRAHGAWTATGERMGAFTYVYIYVDMNGRFAGTTTFRGEVKVNGGGNQWVQSSLLGEEAGPNGSPSAGILLPDSPQQLQAERITAEPLSVTATAPEPGESGYAPATPRLDD